MRKPLIAGNWKMNLDKHSGCELASKLANNTRNITNRDILICPGFPLLSDIAGSIQGSRVLLGAQNMYHQKKGAYTGEVSADMILSVGCTHVILGHSDRRHVFKEPDTEINKKALFALENGLKPILCVGELLEQKEKQQTEQVVKTQVVEGLKNVSPESIGEVIIAYEPVWAIGTGKTATPEDADGVQSLIRNLVSELYESSVADGMVILYGGSVKPDNIDGLMAKENVDGVLVGGASLKADSFTRIVKYEA
ncbi:MAG: triose-phosphate isomerase [Spirochaetota bacterium]